MLKRAATRACDSADSFRNTSENGILPSVLHSMTRAEQFTANSHQWGTKQWAKSKMRHTQAHCEGVARDWGMCA